MPFNPPTYPKVLTLYLELSQYPILAPLIRQNMREELFAGRIISREAFEAEVREKAIQSQEREGLKNTSGEEAPDIWRQRTAIVRDQLTDFYFAYNFPHERFEELVRQVLADRVPSQDVVLTFHPELAPWEMLFTQGEAYEALSQEDRRSVEHHLEEIKVVLIKAMISDHLEYVAIAKQWFDISDLKHIRSLRRGRGKIGGKAAGMMLAERILRKSAKPELLSRLQIPRSWFLGADVFYQFTQMNGLLGYANQKYKTEEEIQADYPVIIEDFARGVFPEEIINALREILEAVGRVPLIVRSSSLLEDSFGSSFAGKYESYFCPNQRRPEENLNQLLDAIRRVYAGVYSPDVLRYRHKMGLVDYDERMAILLQEVQGRQIAGYFLPDAAGVAFSRNQFRWSARIDRNAGFLRLVWGLGTRAVDTHGGDYPRLVALSHPSLRPQADPREMRHYSQRQVDLVDLEANAFRSAPLSEVLHAYSNIPSLRWIAQRYQDGEVKDFIMRPSGMERELSMVTFDGLLGKTSFPRLTRHMLETLESAYGGPVDVEFALLLDAQEERQEPEPQIFLLQCRPLSQMAREDVRIPKDLPDDRRLFLAKRVVPDGHLSGIRYAVYVRSHELRSPAGKTTGAELARLVGRINRRLADEAFLLIGPGRWGSINPELGIPVTYGDIYNAKAIIEVFDQDKRPEPSYGTHFFQDLVEAQIYPLALGLSDPGVEFNRAFFEDSPNTLCDLLPNEAQWEDLVRVIDVPAAASGSRLELVMNGDDGVALAYLDS